MLPGVVFPLWLLSSSSQKSKPALSLSSISGQIQIRILPQELCIDPVARSKIGKDAQVPVNSAAPASVHK